MTENACRTVILVVEDEPFVRMFAVDVLTEHGMIVLEACCVEEALSVMQAEARIDVLFTDINMPGDLDGLDLARIVCRQQPDMKLIVTSGGRNIAAWRRSSFRGFLSKPYDSRALTILVDATLSALH